MIERKSKGILFNRPGVAGAVLQTASSLIYSLIQSLILFLQSATAPKVNIFTRALLLQEFLLKGVELVGGGSVINGTYPV